MASNVIKVSVLADATQLKKALGESERATQKTADKLTGFGKVAVAALAVTALAAVKNFVGDSIAAFSDLNESLNAVDVTFGTSAEGIKKLGEEAAGSLGLSNAEFNTFAVQMSAFAQQIAGDGGDVVGVVDELSTRVSDFASVMNVDVAEAARLFQSGLAGETEPLRKYGIDLSAAAVNANAMAEGIGDGTGELSEQDKILSRYNLLMKQTNKTAGDFANTIDDYANAQRVANAEMEDAKARIGEILVPVAQLTTKVQLLASKALAMVALGFQNLTGDLSNADYAISAFELHTGEAADSLTAAVTINQKYGTSFQELFSRMDFAAGGVQNLTAENEAFLLSIGYTQTEIDELSGLLTEQVAAQTESARWAGLGASAQNVLAGATADAAEATEEATTALEHYEEVVRAQYDPLFALVTAENDLKDATDAVKTAADEFTTDSPEYVTALEDQALAFMDVRAAQLRVAEQSGLTREEFETNLVNMGIFTREQVDKILADFDRVNAFDFTKHTVVVNGVVTGFGMPRFHEGGKVPGPTGADVPIMAQAGETVLPIGHEGNGNGGGTVINLTVTSLDPAAAARLVVQALQSYERSNGAIPVRVRQP